MVSANVFVIGAPKAGTTSVASWLGAHPDIAWSVPKEPHFWSADFPRLRAHYGFDRSDAYEALYANAGAARWRGDGSTTYLYSHVAVPAILEAEPAARFIVCLRRPDDLVPSYHRTELIALNETEPDVEKAWHRAVAGRPPDGNPLDPKLVDYPLIGAIGSAAARVADLVPTEQLSLVLFDDIRDFPQQTYRSLLSFLELDPSHELELVARNASDKQARFEALRRVMHRPPAWLLPAMSRFRQWSRTTDLAAVQRLKRSMWRQAERPTVTEAFRAELRRHFAGDIDQVERLVGRSLDAWRSEPEPPTRAEV